MKFVFSGLKFPSLYQILRWSHVDRAHMGALMSARAVSDKGVDRYYQGEQCLCVPESPWSATN